VVDELGRVEGRRKDGWRKWVRKGGSGWGGGRSGGGFGGDESEVSRMGKQTGQQSLVILRSHHEEVISAKTHHLPWTIPCLKAQDQRPPGGAFQDRLSRGRPVSMGANSSPPRRQFSAAKPTLDLGRY